MLSVAFFLPSAIVIIVGGLILWSNPHREVNRAICFSSVHVALWLIALTIARSVPHSLIIENYPLFWIRFGCAIGAWMPLNFWIVKEVIVGGSNGPDRAVTRRAIPWFLISGCISAI